MSDTHIPVMLNEVLEAVAPKDGEIIVDGTFGGGGYTKAFLENADCTVLAIDRDPTAYARAQELEKETNGKVKALYGAFSAMADIVANENIASVDAVVLDIGVSSFQIDKAERGFSFQKDGPLDMRMDTSCGQTAKDMINGCVEKELADLFWQYGQERHSRRLASAIVKRREEKPFETTLELAEFIRDVLPHSRKDKQHPATRAFQALRIAVNDELGELERGLRAAEIILKKDGRLVVVTFHSLEDSIVKQFLKERAESGQKKSRLLPGEKEEKKIETFKLVEKKAIAVSDIEARENPRARSAKLRWALRTDKKVAA